MRIDAPLVRRLVANQFPDWADLPIRPVANGGHDNRTFHLGDAMSVRLPSAHWYAAHVKTEHEWLPRLEPLLPLPIPVPLAMGKPTDEYPWNWSINKWLEGETATMERITDPDQFARDLAHFLNELQKIDTTGAPAPGQHNFFRGGDLSVYDEQTRDCIHELRDIIDTQAATTIWDAALNEKRTHSPVWIHGDVAAGNLLVREGRLCAVIDFGQLAAGDPACDLTIAWTLLSESTRQVFRAALHVDDATWVRARGWGLWKAMLELCKHRGSDPANARKSQQLISDILSN